MPAITANGRNPGVFACAHCHLPRGTGLPENANLTGLSAAYIAQPWPAGALSAPALDRD